jgi:hypothetical protein
VSVAGLDIANTGDDGITLSTVTASISGVSDDRTGTIDNASGNGISATNSDVSVSDVTVTSAGLSGIYLKAGGQHAIVGNHVSDAERYGIECASSPSFESCATNDFVGTLGSELNCGACEAVEDTDVP